MGYMAHHTIVVCGWQEGAVKAAHAKAVELCDGVMNRDTGEPGYTLVSPILGPYVNGYTSFFISPDGSKEGWDTSQLGDTAREAFTEWLQEQRKDGKYLDWVEVRFGGDDPHKARIEGHVRRTGDE